MRSQKGWLRSKLQIVFGYLTLLIHLPHLSQNTHEWQKPTLLSHSARSYTGCHHPHVWLKESGGYTACPPFNWPRVGWAPTGRHLVRFQDARLARTMTMMSYMYFLLRISVEWKISVSPDVWHSVWWRARVTVGKFAPVKKTENRKTSCSFPDVNVFSWIHYKLKLDTKSSAVRGVLSQQRLPDYS